MKRYNTISENPQSTVVAEYTPEYRTAKSYQSEAELERAFIKQLESQAYEYLAITSEADLVLNLRKQLEQLNDFTFSDAEWERFFTGEIANPNQRTLRKPLFSLHQTKLSGSRDRCYRSVVEIAYDKHYHVDFKCTHNNRINSDWQLRCASLPAGYAERYPSERNIAT